MEDIPNISENPDAAPPPSPAPAPVAGLPSQEYSDCSYICFYIDPSIYEKGGFTISSSFSNLNVQEIRTNNNIVVFCINCQGLLNFAFKLFKSTYYFKVSYKFKNSPIFTSNYEFIVEKNKIQFIYDAGKKGSISNELFRNPTCLEQYNAFCQITKKHDILFEQTTNFLSQTLDMELFLYLLQSKKEKHQDLMSILSNFPYLIIKYEKDKQLPKMDFSPVDGNKYYKKLLLIYSIIQDSNNLLNNFEEDDISNYIEYNEIQKDQPIHIKKNIFNFFISKCSNEKNIKKICQSVYSIPLLFDYLIELPQEQFKKIKDLKFIDLPSEYSINDHLIELIEKYEKIKEAFHENEIDKVWKKYLSLWYRVKNIKDLEEVIDKFNSINEKYYSIISNEIKSEVINKGKKLIEKKKLKSLDMYKFINKYNSIGDFFSDENLLKYIGANIILDELKSNEDALKEFNQCKFFLKIHTKLINNYINGTLSQVNNFEKFYLYFKYIYLLKEKEEENDEKNLVSVNLILSHFVELLTKISNIKMNDEFKDIVYKIIVLSLMYITDNKSNNYYIKIISDLGICRSFTRDDLFNLFIETIINTNIESYVSNEIKDKVCEYIIKTFYFDLNIEKKIDFLLKINSIELKEKLIFEKFPKLEFSDFLLVEENISFSYLKQFIQKGLITNEEFLKSKYFKDLICKCNTIKDSLEKKEINFSQVNQLKELIQKKKLSNRINYICLGDKKNTEKLEQEINIYTEKYILYNSQLDILITYYNKYYPNSKKEEIEKYTQQQSNFKEAKINICNIELNESIGDEIKIFEKYEKSRFFTLFYNNIKFEKENNEQNENQEDLKKKEEVDKFNKAIEIFNECEKLFDEKDFELSFLETPLKKLEDNDSGDNLLKEINYLKENFGKKDANEKQITENLLLYKNKKNISIALKSLNNLCIKLSVENMGAFEEKIEQLANNVSEIKKWMEIPSLIKEIKKLDDCFFEKNFLEILFSFYQNDDLIIFLNSQKEAETRDLIDGLFDDENEENFSVELKDLEILINAVCFFNDIKIKTKNLNIFLDNFHSILDKKNLLYKEIVSNIVHINTKLVTLQDYIKIQLGKKYKYSTNIERFILNGIIQFRKMKNQSIDLLIMNIIMGKEIKPEDNEKFYYNAVIITDGKEELFDKFLETIKRIKAKNIYKYGKNKEYFLKARKIAQLVQSILKELNHDINQEFNEVFKVADFEFINKGILKIPQLEKVLDELRKKNYQIRNKRLKELDDNPFLQIMLGLDLIDLDEIENKRKIESYFPNIKEIEDNYKNKIIHKNISCDGCGMKPIVGIRYKCKTCNNFDYCQNCLDMYKEKHGHEFESIEAPIEYEGIPGIISVFLLLTEIKKELNYLKGLFFFKTTKDEYELDILRFYNKLLDSFTPTEKPTEKDSQVEDIDVFPHNIPYFMNLLLCYDSLDENQIYAFCVRAINCETNNLFIIVRPEEFKISQERFLFKTLNKLLEKKLYKINSCIIILYVNQNSHIIKQLRNLKEKCEFPDEPPLFKSIENSEIQDLKNAPVEIVTSDSPRVGKTHYIHSKLVNGGYFVLFPLGDVDQLFLTIRTNSLNSFMNNEFAVIFELYENPDEYTYNLIKNFLFQFLILKMYRSFNYLGKKNIKIFIEVSSDYTNFYDDFKFLKAFKRHHIEFKNHPDFYEKNKIVVMKEGNVFDVMNYLKLLKSGKINESSFSTDTFLDILLNVNAIDTGYDALIKEFFINKFPANHILPNFGQIEIFSDLLGNLIFNLEESQEIKPDKIKENVAKFPVLKEIRSKIINSYIDFVIKFSALSYESILENQEIAAKHQKKLEYVLTDEVKKRLIEEINKKRVISYNDIRPGIILYNNIPNDKDYLEINKFTILTTYNEEDKQYKELEQFYVKYLKFPSLLNLMEFGGADFSFELKNICLSPDSKTKIIKNYLEKEGYEFTVDNFVKMVLIYLRIRANVPLILLGETGCGKTSLIEALYQFLSDRYELIKFNIHSGLSYHEISKFLESYDLYEKKSASDELKEKLNLKKKDEEKKEKNIILFLDEINTTNSLNLLCDIFVKHSFMGHHLKKNLFVIAACNPYRLMLADTEEIGYINKKMHRVRNLVYTVNPLPLCLINYVFDFGNVKDEDEKKYIRKFINTFLNERFSNSNYENFTKILETIILAVYEAQKYIRKNSEISAVSLREIRRFKIFFEFFFDITKNREEFKNPDFSIVKDHSIFSEAKTKEEKIENLATLKAANVSLFMCFYLRIINPQKRKELTKLLEDIIKFDFLEYPLKLENELADSLNLDRGIAKNRALLDNVFTLFVCLNNKIPVFICGKAGCSKSLSFSLLFEAMKGEYSKNDLFKKYPSLYVTSYQGSLTSSSSEITTIFDRAKKIVKKQKDAKKNISVILFDEMGLAEISPYNPLKVIHSELDGKQEVGFVGISNWTLDASKMNRAIHLSVQEPDLDDLILTATTIANDIYEEIGKIAPYKNLIENLTKSYFDYKNHLKNKYALSYDFHGARDFYYLIKITARAIKNNINKKSLEKIAMESIERNFGGLELDKEGKNLCPSTKKFKEIFSKHQNNFVENINKYDIFSCIKNNLDNENNRYLLLITHKTKNDTLIEFILKKLKKEYRFIQGSKFQEDQNEDYVLEKTWSIISFMENGEIIILKDLEIMYPKFYDLFNQNFQKFGNSQFARIVLDSTTNERHIVNKNFRCIVLLEQADVNEQDPPFLNRFEKHFMSFRYLLTENQNRLAKEIYNEIKDLTTIPENKKMLPFLVNINIEEIRCLLLYLTSIYNEDVENHIIDIYKLLIPTFTQENILNAIFSQQKKFIKKDDLIKIYEQNTHTNIYKFLENVDKNKLIIYTFSPYYKDIFTEANKIEINNRKFGTISKDTTSENQFNQKLSETMLNYFFQLYEEQPSYNLFIMHFRLRDTKYLKYVKYQLDEFHKVKKENEKKIYLFIIHIEKNYENDNKGNKEEQNNKSVENLERYHSHFFSYLSEYQQITIDNLLEQREISVTDLFNKTNEELMVIKELFDINFIIKKEFSRQITQMPLFQNKNSILENLDNLSENGTLECIINKIQNSIKNSDNILRRILVNYSSLKEKDFDFISYFVERIVLLISDNVEKLIKELGKNGYLVSCLFEKEIPPKLKKTIFSFINNINISKTTSSDNLDEFLLDMKIPGSKLLFKKISNLVKNCKIDYLNKDDEYRKGSKKKSDKKEKRKTLEDVYFEKKQYLKNRLWNEELLTEELFSEYFQDILKDYLVYTFYDVNTKTSLTEKQEEFLQFLYSKKNEKDNILDRFLYFCLWIGCYFETIVKLLEIFNKLDKYIKPEIGIEDSINLIHDNQSLLDSLKEDYNLFSISEKDKEREAEKEKVNGIFYRISEAFCHILTNINNIDFENLDLKQFCTDLNEVAQTLTQFNSTLSLGLKGQFSFLSICKLIEFSQKNNKEENEFKKLLSTFIKNIFDERCFIFKNDISQAKKSFNEQINISINLSDELSSKIFVNKLLQYTKNEKYKLELVKSLFQYPQLIKFSSLFFNYIFLTQPIKPKKQTKRNISEDDRNELLDKFGEIKNLEKNAILKEINTKAENNEILKEILIYIFELRFISYFEECQNSKIMKDDDRILILTGLNYNYFQTACNEINNNNCGKLKNLGMIFYFSFIRCYLYYFVKLQLEFKNLGDLTQIHHYLYDISNSILGKMIILYIAKLFILQDKKEYFLKEYLKNENNNRWKDSILSQNEKEELYPIEEYENSKNLLFNIWYKINNDINFVKDSEIEDIYYMINFAYNEMSKKIKDEQLDSSQLLIKINEFSESFNFDVSTKEKLNKLFKKISDLNFFNGENIKPNLKLIFYMIKLYILGFIGCKNNFIFSAIFSDKVINLIKIFFNDQLKDEMIYIKSYYEMKRYLEDESKGKNNNFYPAYVCSCGRWYTIKDSFPFETKDCECGLKIGGTNEILIDRANHCAIYYDENHRDFIEQRKVGKINNKCKLKGILLKEFKDEFILKKVMYKCKNLDKLLMDTFIIDNDTFPTVFLKFIFLSQTYIEYIIGAATESEITSEFNYNNLLDDIIGLNNKLEKFMSTKNINYSDFMNYSCDTLFNLLKNRDCIKEKERIKKEISNLLESLEEKYKTNPENQVFNNIEINILTSIAFDKEFKNENLKYLLTASQYPTIGELKKSIDFYKKKSLPILNAFISLDAKNSDISKLSHIEIINDFVNSFAEENSNLISRKSSETDTISFYLEEIRRNTTLLDGGKSLLDLQFEKFCKSYEEITNCVPLQITEDQPVKNILNDDKIKGKETAINKLYSHLIDIQNQFLNKIIDDYNNNKNENKENIIIKNAIEQIQKEKPIQLCTKADIFSFNVSNNIILSFDELFSFYSLKNIFNEKNEKIDYSKYSEIKFKLNMIEKELVNIILTGKKLFSKKQLTYKFYLDPYEVEEKTKKFEKFTELYDRENLTDEEKNELKTQIRNLEKIILPNLEILIFYLIQENKYQGTQKINEIKFHSNLYLDKKFIQLFSDSNKFTINKLVSIYEYTEEQLWGFISDRYINEEFKLNIYSTKFSKELKEFYENEEKRELKNDMLTSILIKFVCRYLPYEPKESQSRDLFEMIREKNINLPEKIQNELQEMKNTFGAKLCDAIDITRYFVQKKNLKDRQMVENLKQKEKKDVNEIIINEHKEEEKEEKQGEEEEEEGNDSDRDL